MHRCVEFSSILLLWAETPLLSCELFTGYTVKESDKGRCFTLLCFWHWWPIVFLMFLSGFGISIMLASQNELESISSASILQEIVKNWHNFFLKCLKEFTKKLTWASCFLFWKVINCWFNLSKRYRAIRITYFILSEFWQIISFKESVTSHLGYQIGGHKVVHNIPRLSF